MKCVSITLIIKRVSILLAVVVLASLCFSSCTTPDDNGYLIDSYIPHGTKPERQFPTGGQVMLVKLDAKGNYEWDIELEEPVDIYSIEKTSDGYYVAAGMSVGRIGAYLVKVDNLGNILWGQTYDDTFDVISDLHSVRETMDGGYIAIGETTEGNSPYYIWLLKVNKDGDTEWSKTYGQGRGAAVQPLEDGCYIIAGGSVHPQDFVEIAVGASGERGDPFAYSAFHLDLWIARINSDGVMEWEKSVVSNGIDGIYSVRQTDDGGYVLTGRKGVNNSGATDVWLVKMDSEGNVTWAKTFSYSFSEAGVSVEPARDGGYVVITNKNRIIKADANGEMVWEKIVAASRDTNEKEYIETRAVGQADDGYVFARQIYTYKEWEANDIPRPIGEIISNQLFITKFGPNGEIEWEKVHELPLGE
jgi:hypothetical protein